MAVSIRVPPGTIGVALTWPWFLQKLTNVQREKGSSRFSRKVCANLRQLQQETREEVSRELGYFLNRGALGQAPGAESHV